MVRTTRPACFVFAVAEGPARLDFGGHELLQSWTAGTRFASWPYGTSRCCGMRELSVRGMSMLQLSRNPINFEERYNDVELSIRLFVTKVDHAVVHNSLSKLTAYKAFAEK